MSHRITTAAVDSSRLPENRNPENSRSHIDCLLANDFPPSQVGQLPRRGLRLGFVVLAPVVAGEPARGASLETTSAAHARGRPTYRFGQIRGLNVSLVLRGNFVRDPKARREHN